MPYALCPMPDAPCPIPHAPCLNLVKFCFCHNQKNKKMVKDWKNEIIFPIILNLTSLLSQVNP
ncbi:MAG: hypothetical protein KME31_21795 [Tolypothrix carrinoi HA7290-LM1]|nr:hypothetical protein [Tolypothrix carrinoi HA7290-LM1]